uniref:NADH-ubiquinone oxidoreductase chain 4L n=1 Tax=Thaumatoptyx cf. aptyx RM-2016 TaxID=1885851 RepID=A0A224A2C3_9EUPU|nr:NADH dehydrogenase subunit 4L [Thaumatoptyx cf. aptyx RM-2016]
MLNYMYSTFMLLLLLFLYLFSVQKHFLSILIILEAMVLLLLIFSLGFTSLLMNSMGIYLWLLTLSVCEAAMGLTLLVSVMKLNGSDMIFSSSSMY